MSPMLSSSRRSAAESAFERAVSPRNPLYALVDAARESAGPYEAEQAGAACESLFTGELGDKLREVAPHLVELKQHSPFYSWWFEQWGNSVGVLVEAPVALSELRRHFRTLLMTRGASDGKRYYFRFYDPRVLRVFLPSCTPEEVERFFGPITAFYCESDGGNELLTFTRSRDGVSVKTIPVTAAVK